VHVVVIDIRTPGAERGTAQAKDATPVETKGTVDLDVNYATTLVAAVLLGTGFVLQQYAAEREPDSLFLSPRILASLLRKPRWLLGIACMISGYLVAAWSIGHLELTLVEPLLTTYLVWALVLAVPMSRQSVKLTEVAGAVVLCGGVALLSLSRSTKPIGLSFGSFSHWPAAAIIAGVAFIAVEIGRRRGPWRASLVGLGAGLVFGIQDALTRQTLEILQGHSVTVLFTTWPPYCLIGAGVVGIWLMQNAFSAGPLHASLPTIAAGEPVAGIALGIVVFGDRIQISPGQLAIEAGGIAALIVGTVAVARSSAFSSLRKITDILPGSDSAEHAGDSPDQLAPAQTTPEPAPAHTTPVAPELAPAQTTPEPAPAHTTPAPHTTPEPKLAPSPAQRLTRALISRPQAPGQASGGDGG
jgi:drug/metabolite transporter (DMT)-like permease